jgi:hypothetical protein
MEREPLTHFIFVNLSARDRETLEQIANERGATLSGVVRRLIRDTAAIRPAQPEQRRAVAEAHTDKEGTQWEGC